MSLVNDALKHAGKSQPFPHSRNQDILFSFLALLILCLGGMLLWQWSHGGGALKVRARTFSGAQMAASANRTSPSASIAMDSSAPEAPVRMIPILPADAAPADAPVVPQVPAVVPPKPQPPSYVLQSVLYLPGNPSAVINGKTVRINSTVSDARVTAIGPGTATIRTAQGQTKVLAITNP